MNDQDTDQDPPAQKHWLCQECGHVSHTKAMPANRQAFYDRVARLGSPKCPKCKSEAFMPVGF